MHYGLYSMHGVPDNMLYAEAMKLDFINEYQVKELLYLKRN